MPFRLASAVALSVLALGSCSSRPVAATDCATCQLIIGAAQTIAENATDYASFLTALNASCATLFPGNTSETSACDVLADDAAQLLPFLDKQMRTLAWDIPLTFCSVFVPVCTNPCCSTPYTPEQVHLSLTGEASQMRVMWVTLNATGSSTARWGAAAINPVFTASATGSVRNYSWGGWLGVIHAVDMVNLTPGTQYSYQVGDAAGGWSPVFNFTTFPSNIGSDARPLRMLSIGDMGYGNNSNVTVETMTALVEAGEVDVVIHAGDISYADGEQPHWDIFWNKVQGIAARVPYMTTEGNHELWDDFMPLRVRTSSPGTGTSDPAAAYYPLTIGPLFIWMGNTETPIDTADINATQVTAMQTALQAANSARNITPWLMMVGHRPLYCTNHESNDCVLFAGVLRFQAEAVLKGTGVDLVVNAHMHSYERTYPVYNGAVVSTSYASPAAPVYITNGAAGNREGNDQPLGNQPWSAWTSREIGFGIITVSGAQSLNAAFYAANGTQLDSFTITK